MFSTLIDFRLLYSVMFYDIPKKSLSGFSWIADKPSLDFCGDLIELGEVLVGETANPELGLATKLLLLLILIVAPTRLDPPEAICFSMRRFGEMLF